MRLPRFVLFFTLAALLSGATVWSQVVLTGSYNVELLNQAGTHVGSQPLGSSVNDVAVRGWISSPLTSNPAYLSFTFDAPVLLSELLSFSVTMENPLGNFHHGSPHAVLFVEEGSGFDFAVIKLGDYNNAGVIGTATNFSLYAGRNLLSDTDLNGDAADMFDFLGVTRNYSEMLASFGSRRVFGVELGASYYNQGFSTDGFTVVAVPEPSTYAAMFGLATLGIVGWRRYRRS